MAMPIDTSSKHAYLIMAHNNFEQLNILIGLLDDTRNDIYLHIDKKAKDFRRGSVKTRFSNVYFVKPISVTWGGYSQIKCEMRLFECAGKKHYAYYHVLSGVDLPIKSQDEIHGFFGSRSGQNFIGFDTASALSGAALDRVRYYHFFQNTAGRSTNRFLCHLRGLEERLLRLQARMKIKRKEIIPIYKGANWVSITDEMLQYVIKNKKIIKKQFSYSLCADELFLQSVAMASPCRGSIVQKSYREIDWSRGEPYTFRKEDVPELLASKNLFARKFESSVDSEAIHLIAEHLSK